MGGSTRGAVGTNVVPRPVAGVGRRAPERAPRGAPVASQPEVDAMRRALDLASGRAQGPAGSLTDRELEILMLVADGARPAEIATSLFISVKTVKNHLTNVYAKLGVQTGAQAVAEAYRLGLVEARH